MAVVEKFKLILLIQNYIKEMLKLTWEDSSRRINKRFI